MKNKNRFLEWNTFSVNSAQSHENWRKEYLINRELSYLNLQNKKNDFN
jgi:hypothetical protein